MHGVHLQDATGSEAELPAGKGEVDFRLVGEYVPREAAHVVEVNPRHGRAEVLVAVFRLRTRSTSMVGTSGKHWACS